MIEETYKTLDLIIKSFKKARNDNDFITLVKNGLALLEYLPSLINYSVEQEADYRKYEALLSNAEFNGKRINSSAYCETQAKATDFYKNWQKSKQMIELIYELVNMAKKLANNIDKEFNAS